MLPRAWKPIPSADMIRMGSPNDGGYIVSAAAVDNARVLIGFGLNDDWSFESDYIKRTGGRVLCFDHSVDAGFWRWQFLVGLLKFKPANLTRYFRYRRFFSGRAEHHKAWISFDGPGSLSLATILRGIDDEPVFLKMDIEGSEYRVLPDIIANAHRFTGLAIEFHDVDLHRERIATFFDALPGFQIVSLVPNNYASVDPQGDPICMEVSLARADLVSEGRAIDHLAKPNDPSKPEYAIVFEP